MLLLIGLIVSSQSANQPDTILYNSDWHKVENEKDASYLQIIKYEDEKIFMTNFYMPSRKLYNHGEVYQLRPFMHQGLVHWYYENGQIKKQARYQNGVSVGMEKHFF